MDAVHTDAIEHLLAFDICLLTKIKHLGEHLDTDRMCGRFSVFTYLGNAAVQEVQDGLAEVGQQVTGAVAAYAVAQTDGRTQLLALAERIDALQVLKGPA